MYKYIFIIFFSFILITCKQIKNENELFHFNDDEIKSFKLIKKYYKNFDYSTDYFETKEKNKKMIFKEDNKIFDNYPNFEVIFFPISGDLNYSYNFGNSVVVFGSYFIINKDVINIEKGYGKSEYGYSISKNGKKLYEKNKDY